MATKTKTIVVPVKKIVGWRKALLLAETSTLGSDTEILFDVISSLAAVPVMLAQPT